METSLNFAQKTNFIAGCPQIKGLEFYLQSVSLPGVSLELGNAKTFALGAYFAPSAHSFSDLSLDILIDENFEIYNSFFQNIVDAKSLVNGTYAQIEFDFYVQVYNNKGKLLKTLLTFYLLYTFSVFSPARTRLGPDRCPVCKSSSCCFSGSSCFPLSSLPHSMRCG